MAYVKFEPLSDGDLTFIGETLSKVQQVSAKHTAPVSAWYAKKD